MNSNTYERLRFNISSNIFVPNEVVNAALCRETQELHLHFGIGSTTDSIDKTSQKNQNTQPALATGTRPFTVPGISFNDLVSTYMGDEIVDILKVDIEGAEHDVFEENKEGCNALERCRYLIMEIHHADRHQAIVDALKSHGLFFVANEGLEDRGVHLFENRSLLSQT